MSDQEPKKPKNLHIAHRRSPSELTTLMVEQYNLQRQLEAVQAQQKQILQQQSQQAQYSYPPKSNAELMPPPSSSFRGPTQHSKSASFSNNGHRRTGSNSNSNNANNATNNNNLAVNNVNGHNRRHSLGLNEAIKAAANQRQSNRSAVTGGVNSSPPPPISSSSNNEENLGSSFKFPAEPASGSSSDSPTSPSGRPLAYGQPSFKFPPESAAPAASNNPNTSPSLLPPTPNFDITTSPERSNSGSGASGSGHQRRNSHYRSNSRNFDPNGAVNMNLNWRSQQHQRQPSQQQGQGQNQVNNYAHTLEPPSFVPGHKSRNSSYGGGSSISSLSHFMPNNSQNNQNSNSNGRKSLFAPYLPQSPLPDLIADGRLVTGTLRVNKKNRSDAYVSTDGLLDADIFICGSKDRNRALEGDLVAIELLVVDEVWESKKEKEEKKRRKDNTFSKGPASVLNDDIHNDATSSTKNNNEDDDKVIDGDDSNPNLTRRGSLKQRPTMKKNDDVEVEGQSLLLVEEEEINDEIKPLYAGHVVAVVDRIPGQLFSGTLGLLRPAQAAQVAKDKKNGKESNIQTPKSPKIVWFKPTDKKVPLIAIPTEQAPRDFVENHEKYSDQLFVASIKRWPITSLHPFGTLVNKLGSIDDSNTEIDSILRDNNFSCDEYGEIDNDEEESNAIIQSYIKDLPSAEDEILNQVNRVEYLNEYVIAFSPNGQFVDHALHVKRLSNTKIELGFHSVDVSFFVKPGSVLDRKAKKRSSSVFLPQKQSHLLPPQVNEIISFKEGEKNLAVSVIFEIDTTNFEVEDLYIHESIIVPKQIVSYDAFDTILNNDSNSKVVSELSISSATCDYIKTLSLIAREFRRQRLDNKSLNISPNLTLLDQLDDERVRLDLNIFKDSSANDIILEISHKVNGAIAAKIHAGLGDLAMLRRHALPTLQKMEVFVRKANNLGVKIDTTNAATLQNSIIQIDDPVKRQCIEILLFKCMSRGKYFVAGKQDPDSYGHYYFNLPLYTHFNAPIRRYVDILVHRQLKSILKKDQPNNGSTGISFDLESLKATADYCNFKKDCAANAQEQAIHLLLSQTIDDLSQVSGQLLCMGTVIQVYESSFDVFIPEIGVEKRVHGDQLPLVKAEFDKNERILELFWEKGVDSATYIPPDEKSSLSYRSSIKNKHRTSAVEAAKLQISNSKADENTIIEKLSKFNLSPPVLKIPSIRTDSVADLLDENTTKSMPSSPLKSDYPKNLRTSSSNSVASKNPSDVDSGVPSGLRPYLQDAVVREENNHCIQEIRELKQVPVLIRAEIGMALPCLTVRILNPFS
ncbi:virulence protein Ssd1p [[Candida] railenensis]|uniref:Virulence protein Ssd1p n=1 Tax=[Candida] railenensis TaxID=45579 RepID=A0A9P0VYM7_9ASCO|nr:virulence protein Ssd1p [[Candida] railenensis]